MPDAPLLLYDGSCGFCSWWVRQILARDRRRRFRFTALESEPGRALTAAAGLPAGYTDSIVLRRPDGRVYTRSAAALRVAIELGWPWRALGALLVVPAPVRDAAYRAIARRRHGFGPPAHDCPMPAPGERERID